MGKCSHDVEACYPPGADGGMYPYMMESPQLRWAFIRKVYAIVCLQLLLTVAVAATVNLVGAIGDFFRSRTMGAIAATIAVIIFPILVMIPMIIYRKRHPVNLVLLALFTVGISFAVGLSCLSAKGPVILEAVVITMVVVLGLTAYTFWAAKQGYDFEFLGPFLVAALLILMLFGLVRILFPLGKTGTMVYGCIAALVFSGFIIYDTDNLIKRYSYDEYVAAAIELYLDIINLFQAILAVIEGVD
ncbi:protein LIFEGUARD 2-like [Miscanthus floridulus]|uniref:protein LIFEGUARD 2-like n=1 Tax=Miscanthus floridulus TaxID=154761 RepID=UPI00345ADC75